MTLKNDAPYKVEPTMIEKYHEEQRNRLALKPPVVSMEPAPQDRWDAKDVKLLLDTVRLTSPFTLEQLKKIQAFVGILVEIKEMR